MGVLTDYVLAPVADAEAVAQSNDAVSRWGGIQQKGIMSTDLSTLLALLRGEDPDGPALPRSTFVNPFTKAEVVVTNAMQLNGAFEMLANDDEVCVERLPDDLVQRLATTSDAELRALASSWADSYEEHGPTATDAHAFLVALASLARRSVAEAIPVLLRTCP